MEIVLPVYPVAEIKIYNGIFFVHRPHQPISNCRDTFADSVTFFGVIVVVVYVRVRIMCNLHRG